MVLYRSLAHYATFTPMASKLILPRYSHLKPLARLSRRLHPLA